MQIAEVVSESRLWGEYGEDDGRGFIELIGELIVSWLFNARRR